MSAPSLEDLLRSADDAAPRRELVPPSLEALEARHRRRLARRGGALLLLAALAVTATFATREAVLTEPPPATVSLERSLDRLESTLASLRGERDSIASAASEEVALDTFRALHRGALRGDDSSIDGMRWLARRFPATHGGRCARLYLSETTDPTQR